MNAANVVGRTFPGAVPPFDAQTMGQFIQAFGAALQRVQNNGGGGLGANMNLGGLGGLNGGLIPNGLGGSLNLGNGLGGLGSLAGSGGLNGPGGLGGLGGLNGGLNLGNAGLTANLPLGNLRPYSHLERRGTGAETTTPAPSNKS